jgi:hypothetical protein
VGYLYTTEALAIEGSRLYERCVRRGGRQATEGGKLEIGVDVGLPSAAMTGVGKGEKSRVRVSGCVLDPAEGLPVDHARRLAGSQSRTNNSATGE